VKITGLVCFLAKGIFFVKVETDAGVSGFGECSRKGENVLLPIIREVIKPQLIGQSPFDIEKLEHDVIAKNYKISGQLLAMAFSGVEIALWDIKGKYLNQPVYNLLGGKYRDRLEFYGSSLSRHLSPAEEAAKISKGIEQFGFKSVKIKIGPRYGSGDPVDLEKDEEKVKTVREAIGPDCKLMIDANSSYNYTDAIRLFEKVRSFNIYHYEEPCPYYDVETYIKLAQLPVPIHVGEHDWNIYTFRDFISRGACHLYAPDLTKCGGFISAARAAALCRAFGVTYAAHNTSRSIGLAATVQFVASAPECSYYNEYLLDDEPSEQFVSTPFEIKNGTLEVPSGPGLGIELDIEKMEKTLTVVQ
jgi:L-alanine-DL-glutamate epimerase-like enolase superfamily enzyme